MKSAICILHQELYLELLESLKQWLNSILEILLNKMMLIKQSS